MTTLIGILGAATGVSLIAFFTGDHIISAFKDDDGDGIPNIVDRVDNRVYASGSPAVTSLMPESTEKRPATNFTLQDLERKSGLSTGQIRASYADYKTFSAWCADQFDYISSGNIGQIWGHVKNFQNPPRK